MLGFCGFKSFLNKSLKEVVKLYQVIDCFRNFIITCPSKYIRLKK